MSMRVDDPTYYAYVHAYPEAVDVTGVFYVGKGRGKRGRNMTSRSPEHRLMTASFAPDKTLVGWMPCSSSDIAYELERGLVKCLKRAGADLLNKTAGGGGLAGFELSDDAKRRISEGKLGDKNPMRRPEVAARMTQTKREAFLLRGSRSKKPAPTGRSWAEALVLHRKRFQENNPSTTEEGRQLRSEWSKARWADPDQRDKQVSAIRAGWTDERRDWLSRENPSRRPEVNAKKSAALKGRPQIELTCPHCGKNGRGSAMLRYHFTKCAKDLV